MVITAAAPCLQGYASLSQSSFAQRRPQTMPSIPFRTVNSPETSAHSTVSGAPQPRATATTAADTVVTGVVSRI